MMLDTQANALRYKAAGFTDAQVEALIEADRMVAAARDAPGPSRASRFADHWRLWFAVAAIGAVGFCDWMLFLALKHGGGY